MERTPPVSAATRLRAVATAPFRRMRAEWFGTPFHGLALAAGRPRGAGAKVRSLRPADAEAGRRILDGSYVFWGETLDVGPGGDPWNRPSPSRRFAEALHRSEWIGDVLALGPPGETEALRLTLAWRRQFRRWTPFSWDERVLTRRVVSLATALGPMLGVASDAEAAALLTDLSRQARQLMALGGRAHAAERAA
ncbi:MAG TPA: heparinase, partial [Caulobacteraceae bacterium]|nr:heparinase [Caulobacteraceae bacterium]